MTCPPSLRSCLLISPDTLRSGDAAAAPCHSPVDVHPYLHLTLTLHFIQTWVQKVDFSLHTVRMLLGFSRFPRGFCCACGIVRLYFCAPSLGWSQPATEQCRCKNINTTTTWGAFVRALQRQFCTYTQIMWDKEWIHREHQDAAV